ncbi:hypothetical protein E2C01_061882 [Portunus trituberculatus]|uniref:Uncharacterized protein n=1 Tax=Portunus trituberculatus TaxID=210409 RepID=A0A5B7H9I1_PORTR|nr:hypothetical protein [Portunus trituberculatus]
MTHALSSHRKGEDWLGNQQTAVHYFEDGWGKGGGDVSEVCSVLHPSQHALQHQSLPHHGLRQVIFLLHLLTVPLQYLLHQVALERGVWGVHHLFVLHAATDGCT